MQQDVPLAAKYFVQAIITSWYYVSAKDFYDQRQREQIHLDLQNAAK